MNRNSHSVRHQYIHKQAIRKPRTQKIHRLMLPKCAEDRLRVMEMVSVTTRVEKFEDRVCYTTKLIAQICIKVMTSRKYNSTVIRRRGTAQYKLRN